MILGFAVEGFCICFDLVQCSASPERLDGNNLFLVQALWGPCIEIYAFFSRHQKWIAPNAFHGQALATALKSNTTVVDINLAVNLRCDDEGAEERWTWVQGV